MFAVTVELTIIIFIIYIFSFARDSLFQLQVSEERSLYIYLFIHLFIYIFIYLFYFLHVR